VRRMLWTRSSRDNYRSQIPLLVSDAMCSLVVIGIGSFVRAEIRGRRSPSPLMYSWAPTETHRSLVFSCLAISSQDPQTMIEVFDVADENVEVVLVNGCVVGDVHCVKFKVRLFGYEDTMNVRRNQIKWMSIYT
jgi:hypothetical protein